jgi:choline dehydrogenase-like flavoprotein
VQTPKILELSGIGQGERIRSLGLQVVHDLPGVGENLQDHLQLRAIYKVTGVPTLNELYAQLWRRPLMAADYAFRRRGPMTMAPSHMGAFARSNERHATPNIQFHIQPLSLPKFGDPLHDFPAMTISACNLRPDSRGSVHAKTADPDHAPAIDPNYLAAESDRITGVESIHLIRKIAAEPALQKYAPEEFLPGAHVQSDEDLRKAAGDIGTTIFHPVGTAKMGLRSDPAAVVDDRLRVFGIEGLRVVDASIMPNIVRANTNLTCIMIGERVADWMREEA